MILPAPTKLDTLGNEFDLLFDRMRRRTVNDIIALGGILLQAKGSAKHGGWLPWLDNRGIADRTARRWMKIARLSEKGMDPDMIAEHLREATLYTPPPVKSAIMADLPADTEDTTAPEDAPKDVLEPASLPADLVDWKDEAKSLKGRLEFAEARLSGLDEKKVALERQMHEQLRSKLRNMKKKAERTEWEADGLREQVKDLSKRVKELERENETLRMRMEGRDA